MAAPAHAGVRDELHLPLIRAIHVQRRERLSGLRGGITPGDFIPQGDRLIHGDELIEDVRAPHDAILADDFLPGVFPRDELVEHPDAVGERRAADADHGRVQAEQHCPLEDGEADVLRDDHAHFRGERAANRVLEERRLREAADQEEEFHVVHLRAVEQVPDVFDDAFEDGLEEVVHDLRRETKHPLRGPFYVRVAVLRVGGLQTRGLVVFLVVVDEGERQSQVQPVVLSRTAVSFLRLECDHQIHPAGRALQLELLDECFAEDFL